jgi:hypothetical protein
MTTFAWAKLWIDTVDDPKMGMLDDHLWRRFFELVMLAKERNDGGYLPSVRDLSWRLHTTLTQMQADLEALAQVKDDESDNPLVIRDGDDWYLPAFTKRQETAMESKERMRRMRERNKYVTDDSYDAVTDRHTEEEVEVEQEVEEDPPATRPETAPPVDERPPIDDAPTIPGKSNIKAVPDVPVSRFEQPDPVLKDVWRPFLDEMRGQMTQATYDQWYGGLSPGPIESGCVYIGVPTRHTYEWLQFRHQPMIKRTLDSLLGTPHDVTFQVIGETVF